MQLIEEQKLKILMLKERNMTLKIAEEIGVHHSTVSRLIKKYKETDITEHKCVNGWPETLSGQEKMFIRKINKENSKISLRKIVSRLCKELNTNVCVNTVRKYLNSINIFAFSPIKKTFTY
jgi:transposase